jgi:hypothetical protein
VLQAAYAYEQARPWHDEWPQLEDSGHGSKTGAGESRKR